MNIFKAITTRRSIRQFKDKPVELDDLMMLCEMGLHAPSSGDLQDIRFILVREHDDIEKLPKICMDQYWITSAPAVIVVCSQPSVQAQWYGERGRHVFSAQNAAAATQNILLAATQLGLATCWVGGFNQEAADEMFGTDGARVEAIIPVGYANEVPAKRELNEIREAVFFDSYGNDKSDLDRLNKDYSKKLQKHIQSIDKKAEKWHEQIHRSFFQAKEKVKEKSKDIKIKQQ